MFIAIEGVDGAGKATQTRLLSQSLTAQGKSVDTISFPSYGQPSAYFIEQFLNGQYGSADFIDPQLASMFYTLDRFGQKDKILELINHHDYLISDRYSLSSYIHRGTKFLQNNDRTGLDDFFAWLTEREFTKAGLPKPDMIFFLSLSLTTLQSNLVKKQAQNRAYVSDGGLDQAEKDLQHQTLSLQVGKEILPSYFDNYIIIECEDTHGQQLLPEAIRNIILSHILQ